MFHQQRKEATMSNIQKSFLQLVSEVGQIRIPAIQRDYAQGRENEKVNEIRKQFVHVLMQVVKGLKSRQELDFVYGSQQFEESLNNKPIKAFEPLDGQQRLTTLFLIHWMMGCEKLQTSDGHSVLTYSTRPSSKDFCNELVKHNAAEYIGEAKEKSTSNKKKTTKPSEIIKEKDWFSWSWKFDPTIQSMLVMIDAIYEEIVDGIDVEEFKQRLDNIVFDFQDLNELKASDELFVKMNARGKQLSDFDILKSILEEELQMQKLEKKDGTDESYATQQDEIEWRSLMDGDWIDMFWNKYAKSVINGESSKEEKKAITVEVERKFRRLLLRLIALQLFTQNNLPSNLESACYHVDDKDLNTIIYAYQDNMIALRQKKTKEESFCCPRINFRQLIDDMNCIVCNNEKYCEITELLDKGFLSYTDEEDDINSSGSLLDAFIKDTRLGNDIEVIFYSVLLYLRKLPLCSYHKDGVDVANFNEWAKVMRNVTLNVNLNQRIDKINIMKEHLTGVEKFIDKLMLDKSKDVYSNREAVREFVAGLGKINRGDFIGIDNESLSEEIKKADLKLSDPQWVNVIEAAEKHPYLCGQIRCLLDWARDDIEKFREYSKRLREILSVKGDNNNEIKYYAAMLSALPDAWKQHRGLYLFNNDRDNSIKRCLRDLGKQQKELIDKWCANYSELSVLDFFDKIREDSLPKVTGWRKCVIDKPNVILSFSYNKMFFEETDGHVVIAQRKTPDSHCIDPILYYIRIKFPTDNKEDFGDSKSAIQHFVKFENDGHLYMVKWDGRYLLTDNGEERTLSEDELVTFVLSIKQH